MIPFMSLKMEKKYIQLLYRKMSSSLYFIQLFIRDVLLFQLIVLLNLKLRIIYFLCNCKNNLFPYIC